MRHSLMREPYVRRGTLFVATTGHSNATKPPVSRTVTPIFSARLFHDEDGADCRSSYCRRSSNSSWVHGSILVISDGPQETSTPNRGKRESGIVTGLRKYFILFVKAT